VLYAWSRGCRLCKAYSAHNSDQYRNQSRDLCINFPIKQLNIVNPSSIFIRNLKCNYSFYIGLFGFLFGFRGC
jgi:hypothetical protein